MKTDDMQKMALIALPEVKTLKECRKGRVHQIEGNNLTKALKAAFELGKNSAEDSGTVLCRQRLDDIEELLKMIGSEAANLRDDPAEDLDAETAEFLGGIRKGLLHSLTVLSGVPESQIEATLS